MFGDLSQEALKVLLDDSVEHRLFWTVLLVDGARFCRHGLPTASRVPKLIGGLSPPRRGAGIAVTGEWAANGWR